MTRRPGFALVVAAMLAGGTHRAAAQSAPTRYLPVDSWTIPYVDHLIRAGVLRGLDPLTRPLRRADVARALAEADVTMLGDGARSTVELLRAELTDPEHDDGALLVVEPEVGVLAASDASRWVLRPGADSAGFYPRLTIPLALELPHVAIVSSPGIDNRLKYDSLYTGKKDRFVAARVATAYVLGSWRYADVAFGSVARNWGPAQIDGLLISPNPYSREQLMVGLGPSSLRIELLAQQLDPLVPWDSTEARQRWLIAHRLVVRPSGRLSLSFDESVVASVDGLPWRFFNPLTAALMTQTDGGPGANSLLAASFDWRVRGTTSLFGQVLLDDIQVDHSAQSDKEPAAYGLTLGGSGALPGGAVTWTGLYTRVTNLVYRTPRNEEQYTSDGTVIGHTNADYDQLLLRASLIPWPRLLVGGEVSYRRQGAGDPRRRYPADSLFADSLSFLTGVVERTATVGAHGAWNSSRASVSAYLGYNAITNSGHTSGVSRSRWVWRLQASIRTRLIKIL